MLDIELSQRMGTAEIYCGARKIFARITRPTQAQFDILLAHTTLQRGSNYEPE
jgi:hypothetical protein